jgi:DegV family protein with EDD domain
VKADTIADLKQRIHQGSTNARKAVIEPQPGTMLDVLDMLAQSVHNGAWTQMTPDCAAIIARLEKSVADTPNLLPVLREAGVIDAGALAIFIFLEAFFSALFEPSRAMRPVTEIFPGRLVIAADWQGHAGTNDYCVNTLVRTAGTVDDVRRALGDRAESLVISTDKDHVKVHMHTRDREDIRHRLSFIGQVTVWSEETMHARPELRPEADGVHIMTDAAGSLTLEDARTLGVTLLNSYLIVDGRAWPETHFDPQALYGAMRSELKVTTAQASLFERQQTYLSATRVFDRILYLCVGSVYTGNFEVATAWRDQEDVADRFEIIDTGTASGRLGIVAMAVARYARTTGASMTRVRRYAQAALDRSREFVFLDQLKYLAAGGRISKTKGFFGDLMHMKPVVSPNAEGAVKVGVVRNRPAQLTYALDRLRAGLTKDAAAMILVEYSDNQNWVEHTAAEQIRSHFSNAELIVRPLSLTSGAHMGPGTWAVAFLPSEPQPDQNAPDR